MTTNEMKQSQTNENKLFSAYRVPMPGTEPDTQMVEWLQTCPYEWDGDDEGIVIFNTADRDIPTLANPGDWIVSTMGQWFVIAANTWPVLEQLVKLMKVGHPMTKVPLVEEHKGRLN